MRLFLTILCFTTLAFAQAPRTKFEQTRPQYQPAADAFVPNVFSSYLRAFQVKDNPALVRQSIPLVLEGVFLANHRPVRFRVLPNIVESNLDERWDKMLATLFGAFDRDGDGVLNKYECETIFSKHEVMAMLRGQFGMRAAQGKLPTLEDLDLNMDRAVTPAELRAYYEPCRAKLIEPRHIIRPNTNAEAITKRMFQLLDTDRDGKLSEDEFAASVKKMRQLDEDDDELVTVNELLKDQLQTAALDANAQAGGMMGMDMNKTGPAGPKLQLLYLSTDAVPGAVVQALFTRYDTNKDFNLSQAEVGLDAAVFKKLDSNSDGQLEAKELEAWRTSEPEFTIDLRTAKKQADCQASVKLGTATDIRNQPSQTKDRVVVMLKSQLLECLTLAEPTLRPQDLRGQQDAFLPNKQFLTEADVVGPNMQYLRMIFEVADFNGDGKLTKAEHKRYFEIQQRVMELGLTVIYSSYTPSLFELIDTNSDDHLSARELQSAYKRLQSLEPDGTFISKRVIQPLATFQLGHSMRYFLDGAPANVFRVAVPRTGPKWFQNLDRNQDGDVSWFEFVGTREDFDRIDTNKDGLISVTEAEAVDSELRPKK
jgi:Ca2+-binding EF-hand superfamily protein